MSIPIGTPASSVYRIAGMPPSREALAEYGMEPDPPPAGISDPLEGDAWSNLYYVLNNGSNSRYSDGSFGVAYTALQKSTAVTEKGYWARKLVFEKPGPPEKLEVIEMSFPIDGNSKSFIGAPEYDPELTHPEQYDMCQEVGKECLDHGFDFILVPSARKHAGVNAPVFTVDALPEISPGRVVAVASHYSFSDGDLLYQSCSRSETVVVDDVYPDWTPGT